MSYARRQEPREERPIDDLPDLRGGFRAVLDLRRTIGSLNLTPMDWSRWKAAEEQALREDREAAADDLRGALEMLDELPAEVRDRAEHEWQRFLAFGSRARCHAAGRLPPRVAIRGLLYACDVAQGRRPAVLELGPGDNLTHERSRT